MYSKKITIVGTGYVGLVTGACFAKWGHPVTCLDIDEEKIASLMEGKVPFFEPELEALVQEGVRANFLQFTTSYKQAIEGATLCFLALPTPSTLEGDCDTSYVLEAAQEVARWMTRPLIFINKSTVPVGTGKKVDKAVGEILTERGVDLPYSVVSNPEFLREGSAVADCLHPDRILIGSDSPEATKEMVELYAPFQNQIILMDLPSAELSKYAANTMLALRLSFINEISLLCEKTGANIEAVSAAIKADPRIGPNYLKPGIGFGGSCLPKDVKALRAMAKQLCHPVDLFDAILEINTRQREHFFEKVVHHFHSLKEKTLAIWGLSFKPLTDDLREAPSLYLIDRLIKAQTRLRLYDPAALAKAEELIGPHPLITYCETPQLAAEAADAILLITEWPLFSEIDYKQVGEQMHQKTLFDGRNCLSQQQLEEAGFTYVPIGKEPLCHQNASL
jgi:UDPglucose 6-dehydrogenase